MEEEKKDIIKFEMPTLFKFMLYKFPFIGQWVFGILFVYFFIDLLRSKVTVIYFLTGPFIFCDIYMLLNLCAIWKIRHERWVSDLTIDREKKEFRSYVYDVKKEIIFRADDIVEVVNSSDVLRFFLKDGTLVSWAKDDASQQSLEEIIKSFGVSIVNKKLW